MANPFREYESDPGWRYLKQPDEEKKKELEGKKPYDSKKSCWVPDKEEGFLSAEIKTTKGDNITVSTDKGDLTIKKDLVQEMNPPKFDKCEDMSNLSFLNDASVLGNLRSRYGAMLIYTYSGLFCVVINPYKRLPIYTESVARMYMGKRKNEMPPHLFANSDEAYRNMLRDKENQSMLITGESGAGKTENTKKVISYFASVGSSQAAAAAEPDPGKKKVSLEDQIVQTNPVLEAFGNAKTVRNNNSSRFGKFIRIHFSPGGKVAGCDIENYLLEKSRVIRQAPGERCYHIFYQIYTNKTWREKLLLDQDLEYYHFISQAELTIQGVDDVEEFGLTDEAFDILMFSAEEKENCFKLMSAHCHLGEMKFRKKSSKDDQAEPDGEDEAIKACEMLGVNTDEFVKALTTPRVRVGTEWVNKGQNVQQVNWSVGALVKGQYARIFSWLVGKCNETLDARLLERKHFIGVLDIAGFEIFDFNSFEQQWINFVNEKLQQFFNHHMFVLEQEEYKREGIVWTFIDFGLDLAACIELIEKPLGIISMLDEECIVPKATDLTFAQKLCDQHLGKHPNFQKPKPPKGKQAEAHFALAHYAGIVRYNVTNWLEKNKDPLNDTAITVFKAGKTNKLVPLIWQDFITMEEQAKEVKGSQGKKRGKSASMMTVSMLYRESLNNLMAMLNKTHPHFVRCIIPNEKKQSGLLDATLVMNQLTCNGVLEGIRICKKGFPNRTFHIDFKQRYALLCPKAAEAEEAKDASEGILRDLVKNKKITEDNFRVGRTKVFFKAGILALMEDLRDEKLGEIVVGLQAYMYWGLALRERKKRQESLDSYTVIQQNIRNWSMLRGWPWYGIYGAIRPMLGRTQQEIKKLGLQIEEMKEKLAIEEGKRAELEEQNGGIEKKIATLQEEMELRNSNANLSADKAAALETTTRALNNQVESLDSVVIGLEDKNGEMKRNQDKLTEETSELKKQREELEILLRNTEEDRGNRDGAIGKLSQESGNAEATIAQLTRDNKDLTANNWRLKDEIQTLEQQCNKLMRDRANAARKAEDLEQLLEREDRSRGGMGSANKSLEADLAKALEKIEALTAQCNEADANMRQKEQDVRIASERLKDEGTRVSRLEHQLIDLAGAFNSVGRR